MEGFMSTILISKSETFCRSFPIPQHIIMACCLAIQKNLNSNPMLRRKDNLRTICNFMIHPHQSFKQKFLLMSQSWESILKVIILRRYLLWLINQENTSIIKFRQVVISPSRYSLTVLMMERMLRVYSIWSLILRMKIHMTYRMSHNSLKPILIK